MLRRPRRVALVACELALTTLVVTSSASAQRASAGPGCSPALVPVGQAIPDPLPEPPAPAWCLTLHPEPTSAVQGSNEWLDEFETDVNTGRLNDLDMGYRVFDNLSNTGSTLNGQVRSQHFVNQNHWITDFTHNNGGADLSPNRSFHFEKGKLIIEAEVAATYPGYGTTGDIVWPEIEWSTTPAPTGQVVDGLYLYGQFGGNWVGGCRVQSRRSLTCAVQADHTINVTANDQPPCFQASPTRVMEISGFQQCGSIHFGGSVDFGAPSNAWRICQTNQDNWFCRDRFRFEWTRSSLTVYINGILFFQDADWPAFAHLPDHIVSGNTPVYAHFGEWGDFSDSNVYRIHWGYLHINPHEDNGNFAAPSAAESFCPDQPFQTCPIPVESDAHRPPPVTAPTSTPSPRPSTPVPTSTPPPAPARTPTRGPAGSGPLVGSTAVQGTIDTNPVGMAEAFVSTATSTGAAKRLSIFFDASSTATAAVVGIYSHDALANSPGTLLSQAVLTQPTSGWNSVAIPAVSLSAGSTYWIAILQPAGTQGAIQFRDQAGGGPSVTSSQSTLGRLPITWSDGARWASSPLSAFVSP